MVETAELTEAPHATAVDADGYLYDLVTGEVLGHAEAHELFTVDSPESADWVLMLRSQLEGEALAIDAQLEALASNLRARRRKVEQRLAWWDYRFASSLVGWAKRQLEGGKGRTLQLNWGRVKGRKTPASHRILDDSAAVAFVEGIDPSLVKVTKTVGVKAVISAAKELGAATGEPVELNTLPWLIASPAGENWTIETRVKGGEDS